MSVVPLEEVGCLIVENILIPNPEIFLPSYKIFPDEFQLLSQAGEEFQLLVNLSWCVVHMIWGTRYINLGAIICRIFFSTIDLDILTNQVLLFMSLRSG